MNLILVIAKEIFSFKTVMYTWVAYLKFRTDVSRWSISKFSG